MHSATMNLYFTEGELLMSESKRLKQCPICKEFSEISEMYCSCGYEFGGNRCTNPNCKQACDDFARLCPYCDIATQNYLDGYLQGIPSNVK